MSRLRVVSGKRIEDLLAAAPRALEADTAMRRLLVEQLTPRMYSLIGLVVAGCLRCAHFVDGLRGPLDQAFAAQASSDWRALALTATEEAVLAYAEKGTIDEAAVRNRDVEDLRAAGLSDRDILLVATTVAYHNYSIRMAAAFDVIPR